MENKQQVLNFLEYRINELKNISNSETVSSGYCERKITDFYSQSFKPSDITELFEGWHRVSKGEIYFIDDVDQYYLSIVKDGRTSTVAIEFFEREKAYTIDGDYYKKYPNKHKEITLNDFITDCQRAEISLNWKPEILNKYFK